MWEQQSKGGWINAPQEHFWRTGLSTRLWPSNHPPGPNEYVTLPCCFGWGFPSILLPHRRRHYGSRSRHEHHSISLRRQGCQYATWLCFGRRSNFLLHWRHCSASLLGSASLLNGGYHSVSLLNGVNHSFSLLCGIHWTSLPCKDVTSLYFSGILAPPSGFAVDIVPPSGSTLGFRSPCWHCDWYRLDPCMSTTLPHGFLSW